MSIVRKGAADTAPRQHRSNLNAMLAPRSIALIGASESPGSIGRALMDNLQSFDGRVFAVNPNRSTLFGRKVFPKIGDVPEDVDLAVIATPAVTEKPASRKEP